MTSIIRATSAIVILRQGKTVNYFLTYLKGMAMGAADVVPGVSGGTIAFVTGILDTLLDSVRRINPSLFGIVRRQGLKAAFVHINGAFLLCLLAGILTSIFSFAKLISWLLLTHPIPVWSFFFGLILISVVHVLRQVEGVNLARVALFALGVLAAWSITVLNPVALDASYLNIFLGGAIAICAMVLPGISGSFILLLLGLYPVVLGAAKDLEFTILATFALGAICGLLSFSHLLSALLRRFHDATLFFLTGLMLGTLGKIWPWKETLSWRTNSHGESVPLLQQNLWPQEFAQVTGQPSQLALAIGCMLAAILLVWGLERLADKYQ
jgi:putative membrane protein